MSAWEDNTEKVAGLITTGRLGKLSAQPELFFPPYDRYIKDFQNGYSREEFYLKHSNLFETAKQAADSVITDEMDWINLLQISKDYYSIGQTFEKAGRNLIYGDVPDIPKLKEYLTRLVLGENSNIVKSANNIVPRRIKFIPSGWKGIDDHLAGIPPTGLIVLEGCPKSGKSTFALQMVKRFIRTHKDKNAIIFSMEMLDEECRMRLNEVDGSLTNSEENPSLSDDELKRIKIVDEIISADKVGNILASQENIGLAVIDYAEYMCSAMGKVNEENMTYSFKLTTNFSKTLRIPTMLLCQPNKSFDGGIPRPNDVYYTGSAFKDSHLFLALYNPFTNPSYNDPDKERLALRKGQAALVAWASRGGFEHHMDDSPGAILFQYKKDSGFSPEASRPAWTPLSL